MSSAAHWQIYIFASDVAGSIPAGDSAFLHCPRSPHFLQFFSMKVKFTPYGVKIKNDQ
jgi:hypothetical protein